MMGFNGFGEKAKQVAAATKRGVEAVGVFVKGEAIVRCPVGIYPSGSGRVGGKLRGSIVHNVISDEAVRVGTNTDYAGYVEYGTRHMEAQPYLRPAIDENREIIQALFKEAIGAIL